MECSKVGKVGGTVGLIPREVDNCRSQNFICTKSQRPARPAPNTYRLTVEDL